MCFSATASFTASAVLGATGAIALTNVKQKRDTFLATIPVLFAVQQFIEGLVWLTLGQGLLTESLAYGFLFFAFLLWPVYIPLAVWAHERNPVRKCLLRYLIFFGSIGSFYLLTVLFTQSLGVELSGSSLCYKIDAPFEVPGIILYVSVTVGALVLSTSRFIQWFGALTLLSASAAWFFYERTFTSVWCFFAAILSLLLVIYFIRPNHASMRKLLYLLGALIVLILLAWGVLSLVSPTQEVEPLEEVVQETTTVEIEIPDVNPAAGTNPFGDSYKNPFE